MAAGVRTVLGCAVVAIVLGAEGLRAAQDGWFRTPRERVSVTVRLDNNGGAPDAVLVFAKQYAAAVFERVGVTVHWVDGQDAIRRKLMVRYTVVLLTPEAGKRKALEDGLLDGVVGQAAGVPGRAYVYYERVLAMAMAPERDTVSFLGYVIAHELGHLMLPGRGHSSAGIMHASFPRNSRSMNTFTAVEGALIRARLEREASHRQETTDHDPGS